MLVVVSWTVHPDARGVPHLPSSLRLISLLREKVEVSRACIASDDGIDGVTGCRVGVDEGAYQASVHHKGALGERLVDMGNLFPFFSELSLCGLAGNDITNLVCSNCSTRVRGKEVAISVEKIINAKVCTAMPFLARLHHGVSLAFAHDRFFHLICFQSCRY